MPCLQKLVNNVSLSKFDNTFKKIAATSIDYLSLAARLTTIKNSLNSVKNEISGKISTDVNNFLAQFTGKTSSIQGVVQGIESNIKSLGQSLINSFKQAENLIALQTQRIESLFDCEINTSASNNIVSNEANNIQSNLLGISQSSLSSISNNGLKSLAENNDLKEQYISKMTETTINKGVNLVFSVLSNKTINTQQVSIVNQLQFLV